MNINKTLPVLNYIGMILILAGILLHLAAIEYALIIYVAGLIPWISIRFYNRIKGEKELRHKNSILLFSGSLMLIAGVGIYLDESWWIVFIAASSVLDIYMSFRL